VKLARIIPVLYSPGDHENAEHADRELREVHAGEGDVERVPVAALVRAHASPV
jgi:hypothetical protein